MVSPANGATGVPTNVGTIYFAGAAAGAFAQAAVQLATASGSTIVGGPLIAAPSPLPAGVPNTANSEASVPTLAPLTVYAISLVGTGTPCPPLFGGSSGSFTTQ